ncbi:MAG: hypothetical protein RhofKO_21170 [Rhodothermales bacterium]
MPEPNRVEAITQSWDANAEAWTHAVREQQIESRRLVTDQAILDAILALEPKRVLDVGCGEGWLCRALAEQGVRAIGIDASASLVEAARGRRGGHFAVISYEDIVTDSARVPHGPFDAVVCNFALLADEIQPLLRALRELISIGGALVIQTVHPWSSRGEAPYADGWRTEDFTSMGKGFTHVMPWYYRTLTSWVDELNQAGWQVCSLAEPLHPETGLPLSLVVVAE